jgi:serine/threonine protein kinase
MRGAGERSVEHRRPYFVMEFIHGESLVKYADANGLNALQRLALLSRICDAVEYAHHHGVVHCDLKPDNILVNASGQPKILDFGIAKLQHFGIQPLCDTKHFVGTLAYSSPEQRAPRSHSMSPASDVYSLGLIMHELLTGRLPKRMGARLVLDVEKLPCTGLPASDAGKDREFQHACRGIVATALRGTRGKRYTTAGELGEDLEELCRLFSPPSGNRISAWLAALRRDKPTSPTGHSRLLCALLRTRIGIGLDT